MRTIIDNRKDQADFRLMQVDPYIIRWNPKLMAGKAEKVSAKTLRKLQEVHPNWMTDF